MVAKGVTRMFIHNFDSLVTKDYLESRFAASDAAIQARFADFEQQGVNFIDSTDKLPF